MRKFTKVAKSFTIDPLVFAYVQRTSEDRSVSSRLNELLERAILEEQYDRLDSEAAAFFAGVRKSSRKEARAFQKAALRSMARD